MVCSALCQLLKEGNVGMGCKESLGKAIPCGIDLQYQHDMSGFAKVEMLDSLVHYLSPEGGRDGRIGQQSDEVYYTLRDERGLIWLSRYSVKWH